LIDFERCKETEKPGNVTQFLEFLSRSKEELGKKGIKISEEKLRKIAEQYKKDYDLKEILSEISKL